MNPHIFFVAAVEAGRLVAREAGSARPCEPVDGRGRGPRPRPREDPSDEPAAAHGPNREAVRGGTG